MSNHRSPRPSARLTRLRRAGIVASLFVVTAIGGVLGQQPEAFPSSSAGGSIAVARGGRPPGPLSPLARPPADGLRRDRRSGSRAVDGAVPDATTLFDDTVPGVANLDPIFLGALRSAASKAARGGVVLYVESGWRSRAYQERLLRDAITKYGSEREASRWVATPTTSAHVAGHAVDIATSIAMAWLSDHGAEYGLCQIYRNEPWHYELRPDAVEHGCPRMYADAAHDPRMHR